MIGLDWHLKDAIFEAIPSPYPPRTVCLMTRNLLLTGCIACPYLASLAAETAAASLADQFGGRR